MSFQAIKTRKSKSRKIDISTQTRKMSFTIFQKEKMPFQAIKTRSSKSCKIDIFLKGLTHGFGPKMAIFSNFSFQAKQAGKMFFTILNKKSPFQGKRRRRLKFEKVTFFQRGGPMVLVQNWPFFRLFFFGGMGQENVFYDILERRNVFLGYKNKMFKKSKS